MFINCIQVDASVYVLHLWFIFLLPKQSPSSGGPTITPFPNFDPCVDAAALNTALEAKGGQNLNF